MASAEPAYNAEYLPPQHNTQALHWPHALRSVVPAAILGATFMNFPLGIALLGMIASGALSAIFYYHRAAPTNLTRTVGAKLGAVTGCFGCVFTIAYTAVIVLFSGSERMRSVMMEQLNQLSSQFHDPHQIEMIEFFKTPPGLAAMLVLGAIFMLFLFLVFSTAGGALGAAWVRRRHRS